ncbi:DUF262 domain-containing protein [Nostoc sp. FACHB-110]|uniref:DUF262 domain-containing protein n=1 Tax=Nostoc sp. FACHB-110 TaxID=2692834 RepID=UPI0016850D8E|nr:DUF262 domain-containing protein [Nostoc sp. FACHB-110]MBD2437048.1 DUF262 domain-containing protein [Nostoc sp. FACHB-110]
MDIIQAFEVNSLTVYDFFARDRIGYNIPQYQRPYSWDNENIEQLMDDICSGMSDVLNNDNEIHFLGTIITVEDKELRKKISDPLKRSALPTKVENIIDGQQRLSTIAILGCCLYQKLKELDSQLLSNDSHESLKEATASYLTKLKNIFSYNLETRGKPSRKPIIIRESEDEWILDEPEDFSNFYQSDVTKFLGKFIRSIEQEINLADFQINNKLSNNLKTINQWLQDVQDAHIQNGNKKFIFPTAEDIIGKINQENFWDYPRTELNNSITELVKARDNTTCSLIQILGFSYYLLKCCCFTSIVPTSEVRAFDMFQSLNATGTPLTALETFKPLVINSVTSLGYKFEESNFKKYFSEVDSLFDKLTSANSKNERTNEYLTLYAQTYNGSKLSKQFSKQRRWLNDNYNNLTTLPQKENFIRNMGDVAVYCKSIIYSSSKKNIANFIFNIVGENLKDSAESKEAAMCVLYLLDAKHEMAHTILSRFFSSTRRIADDNRRKEFIGVCKAIAAFFTLWRAAIAGKYPDSEYKKLLRQQDLSWDTNESLTLQELKLKFLEILSRNGITDVDSFVSNAVENFRYKLSQTVCKFILFITADNTIVDSNNPGLMKIGRTGASPLYLDPYKWIDSNLETIEHIAPQDEKAQAGWGSELYENNNYDKIGNLTLLPSKINISASNKGWAEKYIYYSYLAEQDPSKVTKLKEFAVNRGINLNDSTINILQKTDYNHHVLPLIQVGIDGIWNQNLVDKRSQRIYEILWKRLYEWLS